MGTTTAQRQMNVVYNRTVTVTLDDLTKVICQISSQVGMIQRFALLLYSNLGCFLPSRKEKVKQQFCILFFWQIMLRRRNSSKIQGKHSIVKSKQCIQINQLRSVCIEHVWSFSSCVAKVCSQISQTACAPAYRSNVWFHLVVFKTSHSASLKCIGANLYCIYHGSFWNLDF